MVERVKSVDLRHHAKFCGDRPNRRRDIAFFGFFTMAATAILDFKNFTFLTVGTVKKVELRHCAKFCRNWSNCSRFFDFSRWRPPPSWIRSFVRSLPAGVQPTLDPSAKTFILVKCASPGRGGELVGVYVRCMCALCRVEVRIIGVSSWSNFVAIGQTVVEISRPSRSGLLSGYARTGINSVPVLTGTSSAPGHLTDTSSAISQGT